MSNASTRYWIPDHQSPVPTSFARAALGRKERKYPIRAICTSEGQSERRRQYWDHRVAFPVRSPKPFDDEDGTDDRQVGSDQRAQPEQCHRTQAMRPSAIIDLESGQGEGARTEERQGEGGFQA